MRKIELLAPAKNLATGIEAINHGADAVYIGADRFSARSAAGNSVEDIRKLAEYAHLYGARVFVALNTVLTDEQLPEAQILIHELYEAGADALIVQDMGILELDLPPIELHASTQTDNRTPEKVKFFEQAGFSQVVLARELSLNQIRNISSQTHVPLEVFVHGALCVSYSGQCYLSEALSGRSANRGACAQYCRLPYNLLDADGRLLARGKHLLSLKDLNQSDYLEQLIDAGVTSLKIEGRLKDVSYVKNITAYYRKKLDALFKRRPDLAARSAGSCAFTFEPNPEKSFSRGFTNYYLSGERGQEVISPDTPKSIGEYVGTVKEIRKGSFTVAGIVALNNGDGLCFRDAAGDMEGFRVNKVEDNRVFPAEWPAIAPKMKLYRNLDHEFEKVLAKESGIRKIGLSMVLGETESGFSLTLTDETGLSVSRMLDSAKEIARSEQSENQKKQLAKLGTTIFEAREIVIDLNAPYFIPSSALAELRRVAVDELTALRVSGYQRNEVPFVPTKHAFPQQQLSYLGNVTNNRARSFYQMHGVEEVAPGFELKQVDGVPLMFTKHCVKYAMGWCKKLQGAEQTPKEPLFLEYRDNRLQLKFDCRLCEMQVLRSEV
ncbi:MAG: peptidase U32 family protein [Bacteroidales bacterium]